LIEIAMPHKTECRRHYVHGDLHETQPGTYYCALCDVFAPPQHFEEPAHIADRARKYKHSLRAWTNAPNARNKNYYRPVDAENIIAELAATDVKTEKSSRSPFFRWLMRQFKRKDPIGDLARDIESDPSFPRTSNSFETLRSHLIQMQAIPEALVALDEGWREFKAKRKVRSGISAALRFVIFKKDKYSCCICGGSAQDGHRLEVDHKVPVSKGGSNEEENLWTLCFNCNRGKGVNHL
jgi:uncharacterized protein YozE (UPF0346 family)